MAATTSSPSFLLDRTQNRKQKIIWATRPRDVTPAGAVVRDVTPVLSIADMDAR
jgi:hypothetical protein